MTAHVLAKELHLTLHTIQMDRLLTKFMGESSAKLRLVFEMIQRECGAYLFDEFDAIGGERASDSDVGEMRRVLNAFLQLIDQDRSDSLIIAATNIPKLLDRALSRRFNDVLRYEVPQPADRKRLIANVLGCFLAQRFTWKQVIEQSEGLSHAEIDHACRDAIKDAILSEQSKVTAAKLLPILEERRGVDHGLEG
jgi:SpoVK/Ycf46/Vps4 family AAA+-type ATPase